MIEFRNRPRKILSQEIVVNENPDKLFPLLCPVREYDWISDWSCDMIYSGSGFAEDNCIFLTDFAGTQGKDVWVVSNYEPPYRIQFVRVNEWRVIRYCISLKADGKGSTLMLWEQIITTLNADGDTWLESFSQEGFSAMVKNIQVMLEKWFEKSK